MPSSENSFGKRTEPEPKLTLGKQRNWLHKSKERYLQSAETEMVDTAGLLC